MTSTSTSALSQATLGLSLTATGASAQLFSTALFSDGSAQPLQVSDGIIFSSLNASVVTVSGTTLMAVANGSGPLFDSTWISPCTGVVVGNGAGTASVEIAAATSISISLLSSTLAQQGDISILSGVASQSSITVSLVYPSGSIDMTSDPRTIYDLSLSNGLFAVQQGALPSARIVISQGNSSGTGILTVRFSHEQISQQVSIVVASTVRIDLLATPSPSFSGSLFVNVSSLRAIAQTGQFQKARLKLYLRLSDGTSRDVSSSGSTVYSGGTGIFDVASGVVSRQGSVTQGSSLFTATYSGVSCTAPLNLSLDSNPVFVASFTSLTIGAGLTSLVGTINVTTAFAAVGAVFTDGTQYTTLLTNGALALPNLLSFSGDSNSILKVDPVSGTVTLLGNGATVATVTVAALPLTGITTSTSLACNLAPVFGDVDLGATTGLPIGKVIIGNQFTVPVRVNTASQTLGSFDFSVFYDKTVLDVVSVTSGSGLPSGTLFPSAQINDPPGVVAFGAALSSAVSGVVRVADITFVVKNAVGITYLSGTISKLYNYGIPIGSALVPSGSSFVSGFVPILTASSRRRSVDEASAFVVPPQVVSVNRRAVCSTPPCSNAQCLSLFGKQRESGDADGNCVFDINDVKFTMDYTVNSQTGFSTAFGQSILSAILPGGSQLTAMDADLSGSIDLRDASFLAKVNFKQLRFMSSLQFSAVSSSSCEIVLSATIKLKGDVPDTNNQTLVYFDMTFSDPSLVTDFSGSQVMTGAWAKYYVSGASSYATTVKGAGLYGGVWQASDDGNGVYSTRVSTTLITPSLAVSVVVVTTDSLGVSNIARQFFLDGSSSSPYMFNSLYSLNVGSYNASLYRRNGFNPFAIVNNTIRSDLCNYGTSVHVLVVNNTSPAGTQIGAIWPQLMDNSSFTYTFNLVSMSPLAHFTIDPVTGVFTSTVTMNTASIKNYSAVVSVVSSNGWASNTVQVSIHVIDFNFFGPIFQSSLYTPSILESSPVGSFVVKVFASDADSGVNGLVQYSLLDHTTDFAINSSTGTITTRRLFDNEVERFVTLTVLAQDSPLFQVPHQAITTVNVSIAGVNEFAPVFSSANYLASLVENTPAPVFVVQVSASDADFGNDSIISFYSITFDSTGGGFYINASTGEIFANRSFDRELGPTTVNLRVSATDSGAPKLVGSCNVTISISDVNDNAPAFDQSSYALVLPRDTPVGSVVQLFNIRDPDAGVNAIFTSSIVAGNVGNTFSLVQIGNLSQASLQLRVLKNLSSAPSQMTINFTTVESAAPFASVSTFLSIVIADPATFDIGLDWGLVQSVTPFMNSAGSFSFGFFMNKVTTSGSVSVTLGQSVTRSLSLASIPLTGVTIAVSNPTVYLPYTATSTSVSIFAQVFNALKQSPATSSNVTLTVVSASNQIVAQFSCLTDIAVGACGKSIPLPVVLFSGTVSQTLTVTAAVQGTSLTSTASITLAPTNVENVVADTNDVIMVLPSQNVYPGDIFGIHFEMSFSSGSSLKQAAWVISVPYYLKPQFLSGVANGVSASFTSVDCTQPLLANGSTCFTEVTITMSSGPISGNMTLFSMQFFSRPEVTPGPLPVTCVLTTLTAVGPINLLPAGARTMSTLDRIGFHSSSGGNVVIAADVPTVLFVSSQRAAVLNAAPILGADSVVPVNAFVVSPRTGLMSQPQAMTSCSSSVQLAVNVTGSCTSLVFGSSASAQGSSSVTLSFTAGTATASYALSVWAPVLPLSLSASSTSLTQVAGWTNNSCMGPSYQTSKISVRAVFTDGISNSAADVTPLVQSLITSSDPSIATLVGSDRIQGLRPGSAVVSLSSNASNTVPISVVGISQRVFALRGAVTSDIQLALSSSVLTSTSFITASVSVQSILSDDLLEGVVVCDAVFSDGNSQPLSAASGLVMNTTDSTVISVFKGPDSLFRVRATGNGIGSIRMYWLNPCDGALIGIGNVVVYSTISKPVFPSSILPLSIFEQPTTPTAIATVVATDPLAQARPLYYGIMGASYTLRATNTVVQLTSVQASSLFSVGLTNGSVMILGRSVLVPAFDREQVDSITVLVAATFSSIDAAALAGSASINTSSFGVQRIVVTWLDLNDNTPTLGPIHRLRVLPNLIENGFITTIAAIDADIGLNGQIGYSLLQPGLALAINPSTGALSISGQLSTSLYTQQYSATVVCTDLGVPARGIAVPIVLESYDPNKLAFIDFDTTVASIDLELLQAQLSGIVGTTLVVLSPIAVSYGRRSEAARIVFYQAASPYQNQTQSQLVNATQDLPVVTTYGPLTGSQVNAGATQNISGLVSTTGYNVLRSGPFSDLMLSTLTSSTSTSNDLLVQVLTPVAVFIALLFLVVILVRHRKQRERQEKLRLVLNSRKSLGIDENGFRVANPEENQPEGNTMIYSGGEVDREAGTAFLYRTVEELKTVSAPVGRGLSSVTTKVVTDQKYWLAKAEPLDDDVKQLPESWGASDPSAIDIYAIDPLYNPEELRTDFHNPLFSEGDDSTSFGRPISMLSTGSGGGIFARGPSARAKPSLRRRPGQRTSGAASGASREKAFAQKYQQYLDGQ